MNGENGTTSQDAGGPEGEEHDRTLQDRDDRDKKPSVETDESDQVRSVVLKASAADGAWLEAAPTVRGHDFDTSPSADAVLSSFLTTGFQATHFAQAVERVQEMMRARGGCRIFLAYTSNLVSSGVRECIRFLVQHRMVDVLVTTGGGIEEDLIKCLAPTLVGAFGLDGAQLRERGLNRIGNLLVPNANYCRFEEWLIPVLDKMVAERPVWTPSEMIARLGREIDHPDSIAYWAQRHDIPYFCPAITDGSLGDMLFFQTYRNERRMVLDVIDDVRRINRLAIRSACTGMIILGGGVAKHHTCNANLMRNGADYAVYINTGQEYDGSDSGAAPDEAVSWGKISGAAAPVKVCGDASILFPLLVSQTFARNTRTHPEPVT